jgi:hydroxymethylglutaryl-CoA synthase
MIGITGWGCYVPRYRLSGETLAQAWGGGKGGSRSVASYDEDSVTMACEATLECLAGRDPQSVSRVYFASTSPAYLEHQNAAIISAVADLPQDTMVADFGGSLRAGLTALRAAYDAVKAEEAQSVLVAAADLRQALPGDPAERSLGDAAGAFLIGRDNPIAVIKGVYSDSRLFIDYWRRQEDKFVQAGDAKFINDKGILVHLPEAAKAILDRMDLAKNDVAAVVYYAPDGGMRKSLDKALGFAPETYLKEDPQAVVGNSGNAQVFLGLLAALAKSKPGDKILVMSHGSGVDGILLEVTEHIGRFQSSLAAQLGKGRPLASYAKFLAFRKLVPQEELNVWASPVVLWREEKVNVRRWGKKCKGCGEVNFPPRFRCWNCESDQMEDVKMPRQGEVFTFTLDTLPPNPDPPTPMVSVALEGGGRLYAQMVDVDAKAVKIGMKVEMVFRRIHDGGGYHNYFWKFRPAE